MKQFLQLFMNLFLWMRFSGIRERERVVHRCDVNVIIIVCNSEWVCASLDLLFLKPREVQNNGDRLVLPATSWKCWALCCMPFTTFHCSIAIVNFEHFSRQLESHKNHSWGFHQFQCRASSTLGGSVYYFAYIQGGKSIGNNRSLGRFSMGDEWEGAGYDYTNFVDGLPQQRHNTPSIVCLVEGVKINNIVV